MRDVLGTGCHHVPGLAVGIENVTPKGHSPARSLHTAVLMPCPAPNTAVLETAGVDSAESCLNFQLPQPYACSRHGSGKQGQCMLHFAHRRSFKVANTRKKCEYSTGYHSLCV